MTFSSQFHWGGRACSARAGCVVPSNSYVTKEEDIESAESYLVQLVQAYIDSFTFVELLMDQPAAGGQAGQKV